MAAAETATAGLCQKCHSPWRCISRGECLFVVCNASRCPLRRLLLHGYGGHDWAAVVAEEDEYVVLCIGTETDCWDSLVRNRRSGQLAVLAPLAAT